MLKEKVKLNNTQINIIQAGNGEPLLFIHGLGSSAEAWREQLAHFSLKYHAVAYDLRGHGDSAASPPYDLDTLVGDLLAVLDYLGIGQANIFGLSTGGNIALKFALEYPERVRRLGFSSFVSEVNTLSLGERLATRIGLPLERLMYKLLGHERMSRFQARYMYRPGKKKHRRFLSRKPGDKQTPLSGKEAEERYEWFLRDALRADTEAILAYRRMLATYNLTSRLHELKCPVLIIRGNKDIIPEKYTDLMVPLIKNCTRVDIEGAGHMTNWDRPSAFNQALEDFLTSH